MNTETSTKELFITPDWPEINQVKALCIAHPDYNFFSAGTSGSTAISYRHSNTAVAQYTKKPITMARIQLINGNICIPASKWGYRYTADACYTQQHNLACTITVADCIPIFLAHRTEKWVAAVHAGWRGLYSDIIDNAIAACPYPKNQLQAWLGPSISQQCYPVGPELYAKFIEKNINYQAYFYKNKDKYYPDLKAIAKDQLQKHNIYHISMDNTCTYSSTKLPSYRRDKIYSTRFACCIWIQE